MTTHTRRPPKSGSATRAAIVLLATTLMTACGTRPPLALTADDQTTMGQVRTYLDGLRHFHARFVQTGTDGNAEGVLWLDRPGHLRVEYIDPSPKLLLANHGRLLLADQVSGSTTTMPLSKTPLDILLADSIDLAGAITVTQVQRQPGALQVGLQKTGAAAEGRLTLQFATPPLALNGVVVQDATGRTNTLRLYGLFRDSAIDPDLFHYHPAPPPNG